jgi:zinc protease
VQLAADTFMLLEDKVQLPRLYQAWHSVPLFAPDDAALDVLAYVLAGDKNSRLYKRLVYDLQVAQDVTAFQNSAKLAGSFWTIITPKPEQTPARMAELFDEELDALIARGVTPEEMARAKNSMRANFLDRLSSVLGKAMQLNAYNYFAGTPDYVRQDAARYQAVTAADVQRVASTYLRRNKVVLTVVPEGKPELKVSAGAQ